MSNSRWYSEEKQCLEGELLETYVMNKHILSIDEIYRIILNLCTIIEGFHKGDFFCIHRELNPLNIVIMKNKEVTLTYKKSDLYMFHSRNTSLKNHRLWKMSKQNDLHSIGMIMYFMATGKYVYTILDVFIDDNYPDNIDKSLKKIIHRCFKENDKDKYFSVKELSEEITIEMLKNIKYKEIINSINLDSKIIITKQRRERTIKPTTITYINKGMNYFKHIIRESRKKFEVSIKYLKEEL